MSTLVTHRGTNLSWIGYRLGDNPVTFDLSASGVDLSDYTFVLNITKIGSVTNVLQLTQGDGITNNGAAGTLAINLTKTKIDASLPGSDYWWELAHTKDGAVSPMFQGPLSLHNKRNPGSPNTITPTVNLGGTTVNVTIAPFTFDPSNLTDQQKIDLVAALIDEIRNTINDA